MRRLLALALAVPLLLSACSSKPKSDQPPQVRAVTCPHGPITHITVKVAHTSDGKVSYRCDGNGPPLVLIMGYTGSQDAWVPAFVDTLAQTHQVIVFDNSGIGSTTLPKGPLTMTSMATQTAALISSLHLSKPEVLGWSMGGMIAQALAVLYPGDVSKLVLAATLPGDGHATSPSASVVSELQHPSSVAAVLTLIFPPGHKADAQAYLTALEAYPHLYLAPPPVNALQQTALGRWVGGRTSAGHGIAKITVPTLVADGNADTLIPIANDHALAKTIRGSHLAIYPDAGHAFLFQDMAKFAHRLLKFLA